MGRKRGITTEQYRETVADLAAICANGTVAPLGVELVADHIDSAVMSAVYAILPELRSQEFADSYITRARQAFRRQLRERVVKGVKAR